VQEVAGMTERCCNNRKRNKSVESMAFEVFDGAFNFCLKAICWIIVIAGGVIVVLHIKELLGG
jgi:hypothetical protein